MFGFHVRVLQDSSKLTVTNPASLWIVLACSVFTLWPLLIKLNAKPFPKRAVIIWSTITVLAYGLLLNSSKVTLDREAQTATIHQFFFYHWTTMTLPLDAIDHAYLNTGATTSRIVLQLTDGHLFSLSVSDQMGGKEAAVTAINRFLGRGESLGRQSDPSFLASYTVAGTNDLLMGSCSGHRRCFGVLDASLTLPYAAAGVPDHLHVLVGREPVTPW